MRTAISLFFILFVQFLFAKKNVDYGLEFYSYEVEKENRTSLNLTPDDYINLSHGFTLSFDIKFQRLHHIFGYVFRIVGNNGEHIDLLLNASKDITMNPQLTVTQNDGEFLQNYVLSEIGSGLYQWIHFEIKINTKENQTTITINDKQYIYKTNFIKKSDKAKIYFGKNSDEAFQVSDIPIMILKNVKVKDQKDNLKYYWKLAQHVHNGVYDEVSGKFASCENGKWLLDKNVFWKKEMTFTTGGNPKITFNQKSNTLAVIDKKYFYRYDTDRKVLKKDTVRSGLPLGSKSNDFFYNEVSNSYFTYNFRDKAVVYDTTTNSWLNNKKDIDDPFFWHHNQYLSKSQNSFYLFNGYGFHRYKNEIHKYNFEDKTWSQQNIKSIGGQMAPRYLSGLGEIAENRVLLFGGYGSENGDQELSPRNYYNLFEINLNSNTQRKIWTIENIDHNFVVANSLIVDNSAKCFYALCYPHQKYQTSLRLYKFSTEHPEYEILGDSILYQFNDINSYADLYVSSDSTYLIGVVAHTDEKTSVANVTIYTLAFPPLKNSDLIQLKVVSAYNWMEILFIGLFVVCVIGAILYKVYRYRTHNKSSDIIPVVPIIDKKAQPEIVMPAIKKAVHERTVFLFGGFQAIDKDGNNITGDFTPILKQLFLLILLYTFKDGKGISSLKLKDILWFDKSDESAKNNRGVSLSKLRSIFEQIGDLSIINKNSYWSINFGEGIYCDYCEVLGLMERLSDKSIPFEVKDFKRLLAIVSNGELLPNVQTEWADYFKTDFSNRFVDLALEITFHPEYNIDTQTQVETADAIFVHDPLSEEALKLKCSTFVKMGKNGLAKKVYTSFTNEYMTLFGTPFKPTFEQITS